MAKEQVHSWMRTGLILAVIVFAGGGWTFQIAGNTTKIADEKKERSDADKILTAKTDKLVEDTHMLALNAKDTQSIATQGVVALDGIHTLLTSMSKEMADMKTISAVNSVQLKTLINDKD